MRSSRDELLRAAANGSGPSSNTAAHSRRSSRPRSSRPASPLMGRPAPASSTPQPRHKGSLLDARSVYSIDADRSMASTSAASPSFSADPAMDLEPADATDFALEDFEDSIRQSTSIDDFTKMIQDFRQERKRRSGGLLPPGGGGKSTLGIHYGNGQEGHQFLSSADALALPPSTPRRARPISLAGSDDGSVGWRRSMDVDQQQGDADNASTYTTSKRSSWRAPTRCTCCCGKEDCERAKKALIEWSDMEHDLKLAAEIGQALLRRNDAFTAEASAKEAQHASQRDSLMKRLTNSIKESSALEKELAQCGLNLEAADSSNRALLAELDTARRDLQKLETDRTRLSVLEARSEKLNREVEDAKQEAQNERKKAAQAEAKARKANERAAQLTNSFNQRLAEADKQRKSRKDAISAEALEQAKQRFQKSMTSPTTASFASAEATKSEESLATLRNLFEQNEALQAQVDQTTVLLNAANEELAELRDQQQFGPASTTFNTTISRPSLHSRKTSGGFSGAYRVPSHLSAQDVGSDLNEATDTTGGGGGDEQIIEAPSTPTLADEIVFDPPPKQAPLRHLRSGSATSAHSHGSVIEHSTATEPSTTSSSSHLRTEKSQMAGAAAADPGFLTSETQTPKTEAQKIRAAYSSHSDAGSEETPPTTAASFLAPSSASMMHTGAGTKKDARTAQLMTLLDYVQRLFVRLASADVDTLAKRLQRQHLAGDVGHLARVTINGITRDAEGLREHFRRLIEAEARGQTALQTGKEDASSMSSGNSKDKAEKESESLVARKEFFALVKLIRDLIFEIAKLRNVVNEIHLSPGNAGKILQEHLGAAAQEDTGVGTWLGKWLPGGLGGAIGGQTTAASGSAAGQQAITTNRGATGGQSAQVPSGRGPPSMMNPGMGRPSSRSGTHGAAGGNGQAPRAASRASAAVLPTPIAVEFKGSRASASTATASIPHTRSADPTGLDDSPMKNASHDATHTQRDQQRSQLRPVRGRSGTSGSNMLSRVQSRNLSGLFAGAPADGWGGAPSADHTHRPLSRIVDDDEISIHQGKPIWRGAGDSDDESDEDGDERDAAPRSRMRPRGLSDSSIHSTFLEHGESGDSSNSRSGAPAGRMMAGPSAPPAPARIMNKSTLALQAQTPQQLQQQRSRGLLAGLGSTLVGWGSSSGKPPATATGDAPAGRPSLRSPASNAALSLAAAAGADRVSSSGSHTPNERAKATAAQLSVPVDVPPSSGASTDSGRSMRSGASTPTSASTPPASVPLARSPNGRLPVPGQPKSRSASGNSTASTSVSRSRPGGIGGRSAF